MTDEKQTRETFTFKQRELNRSAKFIAAMTRLHDAAEAKGLPQKALDLVEAAAAAVTAVQDKLLKSMPDDFEPPAARTYSAAPEVGDTISPKESAKMLYTKADNDMVVKEVIHFGGREDGKGAKIFLKCKRADGSSNTVPAAHFE